MSPFLGSFFLCYSFLDLQYVNVSFCVGLFSKPRMWPPSPDLLEISDNYPELTAINIRIIIRINWFRDKTTEKEGDFLVP